MSIKKRIGVVFLCILVCMAIAGCGKTDEEAQKAKAKPAIATPNKDDPMLILVNKQNPIDEDYVPKEMTSVKYYWDYSQPLYRQMIKEAAEAFDKLSEAAAEEELEIVVTTAYRSYQFQSDLYYGYVNSQGQEAADKFSAKPGYSEHQTGLAADVSNSDVDYELTDKFGDTEAGKWMQKNAHKYGFILRFPKDKEDITGYLYEPWHLRYVGKDVAKYIYNEDITLEEYLGEE